MVSLFFPHFFSSLFLPLIVPSLPSAPSDDPSQALSPVDHLCYSPRHRYHYHSIHPTFSFHHHSHQPYLQSNAPRPDETTTLVAQHPTTNYPRRNHYVAIYCKQTKLTHITRTRQSNIPLGTTVHSFQQANSSDSAAHTHNVAL